MAASPRRYDLGCSALAITLVTALLVAPRPAHAQDQPSAPETSGSPITAGWQDGFVIQSANGDYRLRVGGALQTDGRFSLSSPSAIIDTFTLRKARMVFAGQVAKWFEFRIVPDFANGSPTLLDSYVEMRFSPAFSIRTGKAKTPIGYEVQQADPYVLFPERSLASGVLPSRDTGIDVRGDLARGRVSYAGGVYNGLPDGAGASVSNDTDANSGKDIAARMVVEPFGSTDAAKSWMHGWGVQIGGSRGRQFGALPSFKTSVGEVFFSYAAGAAAAGERVRVSPAVFYRRHALWAYGEFARSSQVVGREGATADVANHGWDISGSYVLTGEDATERGTTPRRPFDIRKGEWGAVQIVARVADLAIDPRAFDAGFAAAGASRFAREVTVGANWYPSAYVKCYLTYERVVFDHAPHGQRPGEHIVLFRVQAAF